jgi:uncharacterized protein (TIGR02284 family)
LHHETVEALQELICVNLDGYQNIVQVSSATDREALTQLFHQLAEQRRKFATELGAHVYVNDGDLTPKGSLLEEIHRWWLDLTGKLERGDAQTLLEEVERGETALRDAYAEVIQDTQDHPIGAVLKAHHEEISRSCARVRELAEKARKGAVLLANRPEATS